MQIIQNRSNNNQKLGQKVEIPVTDQNFFYKNSPFFWQIELVSQKKKEKLLKNALYVR